jgi:hypothetical protein
MPDGDPLKIGALNTGSGNTTLRRRGKTALNALFVDTENGIAVLGRTTRNSEGVVGQSPLGPGVAGRSGLGAEAIGEFRLDSGVLGQSINGHGVEGRSINNDGVFGSSPNQPGVKGFSDGNSGVVGLTGNPGSAGVFGAGSGTFGVLGDNSGTPGVGVKGQSEVGTGVEAFSMAGDGIKATAFQNGVGVNAFSRAGVGVLGQSGALHGIEGRSGESIGVVGSSGASVGVFGVSEKGEGVSGQSLGKAAGVSGFSNDGPGVFGGSARGEGIEANGGDVGLVAFGGRRAIIANGGTDLNGNTEIFGNLVVHENLRVHRNLHVEGLKNSVVPHPDGSHRALYAMESPDCLFEDFGRARMVSGRARVVLDPDFAALVRLDRYHVFLTPEGDCKGLYVGGRTRRAFVVREQQNGRSTLWFSYRIVAARKDVKAPRMARVKILDEGARSGAAEGKSAVRDRARRPLPATLLAASSRRVTPPAMSKPLRVTPPKMSRSRSMPKETRLPKRK